MNSQERYEIGRKVSLTTVLINIILTIMKTLIGIMANSSAMLADGIHSLSDVFSTIAVMIGLKYSKESEDDEHPYGHEKVEPIITTILATILFITALSIGYSGIDTIINQSYFFPHKNAIYAAIISIIVKEWMYKYTVKNAKKIESTSLLADAWHHRSDAVSSIGALIGITGAIFGYPILDAIASLIICVMIGKVAIKIYLQAINQLIDHAGDKQTIENIRNNILSIQGVIKIDSLKTRIHASKIYVDVECSVDKNLSFISAHDLAEQIHVTVENKEKSVKHCMVHVNPYIQGDDE